jgi:purine-binding chemotaxis protein CheW
MLGVATMRGATLPLVSLRVLLGLPPSGFDRNRARVVAVEPGGGRLGLVVDEVTAILRVPPDAIDPVPAVLTRFRGEARIEAICRLDQGRRLVAILSIAGLFDADTTARMLGHATPHAEQRAAARAPQAALHQFVVMRLGDEQYGLPIGAVDEVARCPDSFARVPHAPAFLAGVMNLRGQPVPVIDQRRRFAFAGPPAPGRRRVVVVTIGGRRAGLLVDGISALLGVSAVELQRLPALNGRTGQLFDRAAPVERDGRMILLIEPDILLSAAEADLLAAFAATRPDTAPDIAPDMAHADSSAA